MFRGAFSNALAPGFKKVLFETYKERPNEGGKITNRDTSNRAYEETFPVAGFGTLLNKVEGGSVTYQDAMQGTAKRFTWSTFGLGFRITREMFEDDLYGIMGNRMSKALGRSARNNLEIVQHAPYNNAFDTAFSGFVAGESLASTTHANIRGGTQSNRIDSDFDLLALQAAVEHFHGLMDESGVIPALFIPRTVIHSVGDMWLVEQVLKTPQLPGGNQNDINVINRQGLSGHLSHYLTDPDSWFVLADEHRVMYWERRALSFSNTDDFNTDDALYKATRRNGSGFDDWRGVWGSAGV